MEAVHALSGLVARWALWGKIPPRPPGAARRGAAAAIVIAAVSMPAWASTSAGNEWGDLPRLCEEAAAKASAESGVPVSVLRAIALTETGRTKHGAFRPWPWTVNMEGRGVWFDSYEEARDYVARHHARGARSYDVGCFQINYRWHGQHFASIEKMFDPDANAAYAARFLSELHAELGDWSRAAGAYHSRTPSFAGRYRERFDRIRARLLAAGGETAGGEDVAAAEPAPPADAPEFPDTPAAPFEIRDNRFPLLLATGAGRGLASLVPMEIVVASRLIDSETGGLIDR
jgi:hypothetical protein